MLLARAGLISAATLVLGPARLASSQAVGPRWSYTGNLISANDAGTVTLLPNGKVLIVGRSAELYDPATGTWSIGLHRDYTISASELSYRPRLQRQQTWPV